MPRDLVIFYGDKLMAQTLQNLSPRVEPNFRKDILSGLRMLVACTPLAPNHYPSALRSRVASANPRSAGQLLRRNVKRFRGGLVFKAHSFVYHSTLGLRETEMRGRKWAIPWCLPARPSRSKYDAWGGGWADRPKRFTALSSEHGTYKTVKARSWPWLCGQSP